MKNRLLARLDSWLSTALWTVINILGTQGKAEVIDLKKARKKLRRKQSSRPGVS